jgi:hypothetical protein
MNNGNIQTISNDSNVAYEHIICCIVILYLCSETNTTQNTHEHDAKT